MNFASTDLSKLVSVGDTVDISIATTTLTGKVIATSIDDFSRRYLVKWGDGSSRWLSQIQVRSLVKN